MAVVAPAASLLAEGEQGLVLSRGVSSGAALLADEPRAVVPSELSLQCTRCLARAADMRPAAGSALRTCTACRTARYCSRECQRSDWKAGHRKECESLQRVAPRIPGSTLRLLARVLRNAETRALLEQCVSHEDAEAATSEQLEQTVGMLGVLKSFLTEEEHDFLPVSRRLLSTGSGFYPNLRYVNHSCLPNCAVTFIGLRAVLRATRTLAAGDELCISYVPLTNTLQRRRQALREQFGFACHCERCEREQTRGDPLYAASCKHDTCGSWLPLDTGLDSHCIEGHPAADGAADEARKIVALAESRLDSKDTAALKTMQSELAVLDRHAAVRHAVANALLDDAVARQAFEEAFQYALDSVVIYGLRDTVADDPVRAINFYRLGKLAELQGHDARAASALAEAERSLGRCYGTDHALTLEASAMADAVRARLRGARDASPPAVTAHTGLLEPAP